MNYLFGFVFGKWPRPFFNWFTTFLIGGFCFLAFPQTQAFASDCNRFGHLCEPQKVSKTKVSAPVKVAKLKNHGVHKRLVHRKTAVVVTGLFGEVLAPMHGIKADLRAKGYHVVPRSSFGMIPVDTTGADLVVGHSMGCFSVQASRARNKAFIDCPFWSHGMFSARRGDRVLNVYTPMHPRVPGAVNVPVRTHHVDAPRLARPYIRQAL